VAGLLVFALHYDGAINKNSLGAVSEAARLSTSSGRSAMRSSSRGDRRRRRASLGRYGATKVFRVEAPEGLAQRSSTRWVSCSLPAATTTRCSAAVCSASRSAPGSRRASTPA